MSDSYQDFNWMEAANSLRKRVSLDSFEVSTLPHLRQAGHLLVACSGGADSVLMLCGLDAYAEQLGLQLYVAHYNHRWREEDSDADAAFVESLAKTLNLPFYTESRPDHEAAFTETTARALRLEFLRKAAWMCDCHYIAFGHQLDDVIETQLQRLARGCGSDGLAAPRPVSHFSGRPTHLRPLLSMRSVDIRMVLNASEIPWREDASNHDVSIARNALRKQIIPDLAEALGRDPTAGAARSRRLLEEDAAALDLLARERVPRAFAHAATLNRNLLKEVPTALLRRALVEWLSAHGLIASVGAPAMEILIDTIRSSRPQYRMSAGSYYIIMDADTLRWEHEEDSVPLEALQPTTLEIGEHTFLSTGALIAAEVVEMTVELNQKIITGTIDPKTEAIIEYHDESFFDVRAWQPGVRFQPLGAPGRKKLKDWFIDRRIPQEERKTLPLVLNACQEVIWVPGFPPAEICKIRPSTKKALRLTYQTRNPL
jgi:tRNA(Ile)-lysidine synthase